MVASGNYRVRRVATSGIITTVAGNGTQGYAGDGGPAVNAQFRNVPGAIAADASGNLFVTDGHSVRTVSRTGIITTVAGNGTAGFSGDGGMAASAQLNGPSGLAVDGAGSLYIADYNARRVRRVSRDGIITTVAGGGDSALEGVPAVYAELSPIAVAVDSSGNLYIADCACDWDGDGGSRVRKVSSDGRIFTVAGAGNAGFSGDGGRATSALLDGADALAVDAAGNLYIGEFENSRIRKVSTGGIITSVAGGSPKPAPSSPSGGSATSGMLGGRTTAVALDARDNLLIAGDSAVNRVTPNAIIEFVAPVGGTAITGDKAGNLFVAGLAIRKLSPNGTVGTVIGPGLFGTPGVGGFGIAVDGAGDLFVGSGSLVRKSHLPEG